MEEYKKTMLISPNKVKASGRLNLNVDDGEIAASIRNAQNVYLVDVIGKEFVWKLQELVYNKIQQISGDTIDDAPAYKTLLDEYVSEVLSIKTVIDLCIRLSLKIRNLGVIKNSDTNANYVDADEIRKLQGYFETEYNHWLNRMAEFICENKEAFPESKFDCNCSDRPKYANTGGLYLG